MCRQLRAGRRALRYRGACVTQAIWAGGCCQGGGCRPGQGHRGRVAGPGPRSQLSRAVSTAPVLVRPCCCGVMSIQKRGSSVVAAARHRLPRLPAVARSWPASRVFTSPACRAPRRIAALQSAMALPRPLAWRSPSTGTARTRPCRASPRPAAPASTPGCPRCPAPRRTAASRSGSVSEPADLAGGALQRPHVAGGNHRRPEAKKAFSAVSSFAPATCTAFGEGGSNNLTRHTLAEQN